MGLPGASMQLTWQEIMYLHSKVESRNDSMADCLINQPTECPAFCGEGAEPDSGCFEDWPESVKDYKEDDTSDYNAFKVLGGKMSKKEREKYLANESDDEVKEVKNKVHVSKKKKLPSEFATMYDFDEEDE